MVIAKGPFCRPGLSKLPIIMQIPERSEFDEITILYMQVPVGHPGEIEEIFDTISYNKGASIIRMLHQYVGDQVSLLARFLSLARN